MSKHLSLTERTTIERALILGSSFKSIGIMLGRSPTTISREVRNNRVYDGKIPRSSRGCLGYPYIKMPDGRLVAVNGIPASHAGWDELKKEHFKRTADFGRLPSFEEFSKKVKEQFTEYWSNEPVEKRDAFFYSEDMQEMIRTEYESSCKKWHNKEITENIMMHGVVNGLAYCLMMLY